MVAQWKIINENYKNLEGYKRVAWPPASEERIIREFTPQPATQSPAPGSGGYYPQSVAAPPSHAAAAPPQSNYPQQEPLQAGSNVGGGWKHIGAPQPKNHNEFTVPGSGSGVGSLPQQQYQQQPNYQQQQQQYGAPSYGGYQQQSAPQQPAPQWQQQQQQVPQQQYQPQPQAQAPYQQPQWNQPQQQQPSYQSSPYQQQPSQQQPSYYPQQNGGSTFAQPQYNSYSQPQQQQQPSQLPYSQDQPDLQQQPGAFAGQDSYRGASPGIITLRKEAPVTQKPAPVYTSQPAAVSYQGGSKLRGDLKWPPPEYKEAAARENEERRLLALGPVCRPRRVNRDYTGFFAKHQLNNAYPTYKVPPGTQHMFA
ncbi:vacuolar protein-sorting-associated protein 36 isoform X14 [Drosophila ananassae]|uniref:vacuolar protein-sorting-associated protein 36 isoform X14 n=1 Tax=Drosophila ananassae TaxID=7217 RepID=UPI001CFF6E68|nr:vacuolar protein-sorting-associated protein 36 isoform X14 [Drosophila ananassae]